MAERTPTPENFIVIWLDPTRNAQHTDTKSFISHFQELVHLVLLVNNTEEFVSYISDIKHERIFLIICEHLAQQVVTFAVDFPQIDSIYVHCKDRDQFEKWASKEIKIKGVFNKIEPIYDALRRDIRQCEDDLIPISITTSIHHCDQSFLYPQLMKEILFDMTYSPDSKFNFAEKCITSLYRGNTFQLKRIEQFASEDDPLSSIRWYTSECFVYSILNKAFRLEDMTTLLEMGFFICDLHRAITERHVRSNQFDRLTVYRGQGLSKKIFQTIVDNRGGFLSFNNFLITSTDKDVAFAYARSARDSHQLIGVLFHMEIDRSKAIFTSLDKISYHGEVNDEILFSTHTIFRIKRFQKLENHFWEIHLTLTVDEDEDLRKLKRFIRRRIEGKTVDERLNLLEEMDVSKV